MSELFTATVRDRRRAWLWWSLGVVAMNLFVVGAFASIRDSEGIDDVLDQMPEGIRVLIGGEAGLSLTSAAGYLNGRLFSSTLPIILTIFGIGFAARALAGEEDAGRLELLVAHPVHRRRVLLDRGAAVLALLGALGAIATGSLVALAPSTGLDEPGFGNLAAACIGTLLLAVLHAAVTYGVGAWTGRRAVAVAAGSVATAGGFLLQSLATVSPSIRPVRWLSPWHWFVDARPIVDGWGPMLLPTIAVLVVSAAAVVAGMWRFERRDIGAA